MLKPENLEIRKLSLLLVRMLFQREKNSIFERLRAKTESLDISGAVIKYSNADTIKDNAEVEFYSAII